MSTDLTAARDRALAYAAGLDLDPVAGLELVLEALRKVAARGGGPEEAMAELWLLLRRDGLIDPEGPVRRLESAPPLHRRSMTAEQKDYSILGPLKRSRPGGGRSGRK